MVRLEYALEKNMGFRLIKLSVHEAVIARCNLMVEIELRAGYCNNAVAVNTAQDIPHSRQRDPEMIAADSVHLNICLCNDEPEHFIPKKTIIDFRADDSSGASRCCLVQQIRHTFLHIADGDRV